MCAIGILARVVEIIDAGVLKVTPGPVDNMDLSEIFIFK